ncbi:N-acetylmuramoyl-L-alanine amidase [Blastococcus sp. SYSU D00820]
MRRLLAGSVAFLGMTGTLLVLPVYADPGPEPAPVETSTEAVEMGSVAEPAPAAEVQQGTTEPVAGVAPEAPALTVSRLDVAPFSLVGVTWTADPAVTDTVVQIRVRDESGAWGEWAEVGVESDLNTGTRTGATPRGGTAPLWTGPSTGVEAELVTRSGAQPADVTLELVDPGTAAADGALDTPELGDTAHAATAMPPIYSRAQWGADERMMGWTPQYATTLKAATLHHTDTANTYTADEVPGILRSIYAYHAQSRGWGDIGYNVIVDRFGRMWEGRAGGLSRPVVAAHAGGFNSGTFGISMLGNHAGVAPSQATIDSVAAAIAWKFSLHNVDPRGTTVLTSGGGGTSRYAAGVRVTLPTIFGHRDVGSTTCPGDAGYARMGEIRDRVSDRLASSRTTIGARYEADAALRDSLGVPVGGQQSAGGVTWQDYRYGRLYSSAAGGVRVVRGAILETYVSTGGPAVLGAPISDDARTPDGRGYFVDFQGGSIYWSPAAGTQVVRGGILATWRTAGGSGGPLGFPISSDARTADGRGYVVDFEGGSIYWSAATGSQIVRGGILATWLDGGGTAGPLGFPATSDAATPDGRGYFVDFQGGSIYWSPATGTQVVRGGILATWRSAGGTSGPLGFPTTSDAWTADGRGAFVRFQGGDVYWSPSTGTQVVRGSILSTWLDGGGATGPLGFPTTSDAWTADGRGAFVRFQGGDVYWSPSTGTQVVRGGILATWLTGGGATGPLGFPTSSDARTADGRGYVVDFQGGSIYWSPATGTQVVRGGILATWRAAGGTGGPLGFPTTSDARTPDGRGYFVDFQGGSIYWSAATGSQVVRGGILATWRALGGTGSAIGFPTTSDAPTPDGRGYVVRFQGGDLYWSPATDTRAVMGRLATAYAARGANASSLGFPVTHTYLIPGGMRVDFQGGSLVLNNATGVVTG